MKKHIISILERSVSTFLFAFLGLITATSLSDPTALKAAAIAGALSVAAYLKTVAGAYLGSTSTQVSDPNAEAAALGNAIKTFYAETNKAGEAQKSASPVAVDPVPAPEPVAASPVTVDPVPAPVG